MDGLFRFDGPLYKFCVLIYETFMLSLLWFIGSIPIVTIGASTSALYYVYGKKTRDKGYKIYSDFFKGYKENIKQASILGTIITIVLCSSFYNLIKLKDSYGTNFILKYVQMFILVQILLITVYVFPLIARFRMKIIDVVKYSVILAYKHIFMSFLCLGIFSGLAFLVYLMPSFVLFFMGGYVLLTSYIMKKILGMEEKVTERKV